MPNAARIHAIMDADLADDDRLDHAIALASELVASSEMVS